MYLYLCCTLFFILIKYETRDCINVIHVGLVSGPLDTWNCQAHVVRSRCLAGFSRNVAPQLNSTSSGCFFEAINKNLTEWDRPTSMVSPFQIIINPTIHTFSDLKCVSFVLRFDTAGLDVLTKGGIFWLVLAFCLSADCLPENWTSASVLSIRCLG